MTEKEIEKSIIMWLQNQGFWAVKVQSGAIYQKEHGRVYKITLAPAGTPDVLACIKGKFIGIEVKKNDYEVEKWFRYPLGKRGKKLKPDKRIEDQKHHRELIRNSGGIHVVCAGVDELRDDLASVGLVKQ